MIHFFRRIRQSLISDESTNTSGNRFSKYLLYAIGEIFLVVIGILIALQINNWNEGKNDRQKEIHYLESFKSDLLANQEELERVIDICEKVHVRADSAMNIALGNFRDYDPEDITTLFLQLTHYSIFVNKNATVTELLASGDLKVIANDSIRSNMANWEAEIREIQSFELPNTTNAKKIAEILKSNLDVYKGRMNLPRADHNMLGKLFNNRIFMNELGARKWRSRMVRNYYQSQKSRTDNLLRLIEMELNR